MSTQPLPAAPLPAAPAPDAPAPDVQPLHPNLAVAQCIQAGNAAYKTELARTSLDFKAAQAAAKAYRRAMPPLEGQQNISNFIACVAHGVLISAIDHRDSSKLLYAAQVALSLLRVQLMHPANPPAPAQNSHLPGVLSAG